MNEIVISVADLRKRYVNRYALDGVSFEAREGAFVGALGPNGSGKSTLLQLIATLIGPTSGKIEIFGKDAAEFGPAIRRQIGFLGHQSFLYGALTGRENLRYYAGLYGIDDRESRIDQALDDVGMREHGRRPVKTYSRGMIQRTALARAALHRPRILLLDEPFTGLDDEAVELIRGILVRQKEKGTTCLLSTHRKDILSGLVDWNLNLDRGRLTGADSP